MKTKTILVALLVESHYGSEFAKLPQSLRFFCIVALVMAVGVLWEFHEFVFDHFLSAMKFQGDLADTMKDLLMDTVGGLAGAGLHLLRRGNS